MSGIDSLVSGIFSAMANMKTEKARRTVTPNAIFSPESGGRQNTSTVRVDIIMQGKTMLYLEFTFNEAYVPYSQNEPIIEFRCKKNPE